MSKFYTYHYESNKEQILVANISISIRILWNSVLIEEGDIELPYLELINGACTVELQLV